MEWSCFDCKSTKNLRAIHNHRFCSAVSFSLFRLQKYKKFESNSQPYRCDIPGRMCCFDCKSTKNLRAIHNVPCCRCVNLTVVSTAKVQKIWEQFTTHTLNITLFFGLFRLQKYKKFESNSQPYRLTLQKYGSCFDCKSTKNLRAIHNMRTIFPKWNDVVSTAKVQKIWEQFTTGQCEQCKTQKLFRLQKYKKFESNSQLWYSHVWW